MPLLTDTYELRAESAIGHLDAAPRPTSLLVPSTNGALLGAYFALLQSSSTSMIAAALGIAGVFFVLNGKVILRKRLALTRGLSVGFALLIGNVAIMASQSVAVLGINNSLKLAIGQAVMVAMLAQLVLLHKPRFLRPTLVTIGFAFVFFGLLNIAGDLLGAGDEGFLARADAASAASRYVEGHIRWQAPFYSSWQLSGMLRWALPILLVTLIRDRLGWWSRLVLAGAIAGAVHILIKSEFRAAAFPVIGAVIWLMLGSRRARALAACAFVVYAIAAPLLFTSESFLAFLDSAVPDFIFEMAGNQDALGILSLSGRTEMWLSGVEVLQSGKYLFIGQGHVALDAIRDVGAVWAGVDPTLIPRLSYHQGVIDLLFIYGVFPAVLLLASLLVVSFRGLVASFRSVHDTAGADELSFGLLSLGMVGLANAHDGFFVEHNFFYAIVIISMCSVAEFSRRRVWTAADSTSARQHMRRRVGTQPVR